MSEAIPVRTDDQPMAFSSGEFARGAIAAWVWFVIIHQLGLLVPLVGYGYIALTLTVPWSLGALLVGAPLAFLIGRALRSERRRWVHQAIFGTFGLVIGVFTTAIAIWSGSVGTFAYLGDARAWWLVAIVAVSACPAVVLGWRWGARDALGISARRTPRRHVDPDAQYEDSIPR